MADDRWPTTYAAAEWTVLHVLRYVHATGLTERENPASATWAAEAFLAQALDDVRLAQQRWQLLVRARFELRRARQVSDVVGELVARDLLKRLRRAGL